MVWRADLELPIYIAFTFLPNTKATWATPYSWISQGMRHLVPGTQSHLALCTWEGAGGLSPSASGWLFEIILQGKRPASVSGLSIVLAANE